MHEIAHLNKIWRRKNELASSWFCCYQPRIAPLKIISWQNKNRNRYGCLFRSVQVNLDMTDHCMTDFCIWRTICLVPVGSVYQVFVICIRRILHMTDQFPWSQWVRHIQVHLYCILPRISYLDRFSWQKVYYNSFTPVAHTNANSFITKQYFEKYCTVSCYFCLDKEFLCRNILKYFLFDRLCLVRGMWESWQWLEAGLSIPWFTLVSSSCDKNWTKPNLQIKWQ